MTEELLAVRPEDTLERAHTVMEIASVRHVPVFDDDKLLGMISLRDILAASPSASVVEAEGRHRFLQTLRVDQAMRRDPIIIAPTDAPTEAAKRMLRHHISSLPVVQDDGQTIGLVTTTDLMEVAKDELERESQVIGAPPKVARFMTRSPLETLSPDETVRTARILLMMDKLRHLPVLDGNRLIGMLSERDVLAHMHSSYGPASKGAAELLPGIKVSEAMSPNPITADAEEPALVALNRMLAKKVGALPVLRDQRLIGILTETDFLSYIAMNAPDEGAD